MPFKTNIQFVLKIDINRMGIVQKHYEIYNAGISI